MATYFWFTLRQRQVLTSDRFGGAEDSERLVEAIRSRDEDAMSQYLDSASSPGDILIAAILFTSHETPYSHSLSPGMVEMVKKYCSPDGVINTIYGFWRDRPATGVVLMMKFVDVEVLKVGDLMDWLLGQDEWMRKIWGWEIVEVCVEKVDGLHERKSNSQAGKGQGAAETTEDGKLEDTTEEEKPTDETMQVDTTNGVVNGTTEVNEERKEFFAKIVAGVGACYERQTTLDKEWLKEWFGMVVRKYSADVVGLETGGWVGEMLAQADEYARRFS